MRQTLSHSWKFLTSKLHQPLPLNHRDSQKLLSLLNESFKRNLDRQHPQGLADAEHSPDGHFQSVLKSPLFSAHRARRPSGPGRKNHDSEQDVAQVRDLIFSLKEPVDHFRQQVATGTADLKSAKLSLENQMKKALASAAADAREGMRQSEIGSVMVNWLWSSGQYERLEFIGDRNFIARLLPFLVAEGQYKPIWDWLQRVQSVKASTDVARRSLQKHVNLMMKYLLQAEIVYGYGLQSAIQMYLTHLKSVTLRVPAASSHVYLRADHHAPWCLINELAYRGTTSGVEENILDSFDRSVDIWSYGHLIAPYRALIQLLNPHKPRALPVWRLVSTIKSSSTLFSEQQRLVLVSIGLKAVEILLNNGSLKEAAQVMKAMQSKLASELGTNKAPFIKRKTNEESLLESFDQHWDTPLPVLA
ncbi:MAG: hypothetical protein Q9208_008265 [Pyrenodesmia sp. 3 TL-2023]